MDLVTKTISSLLDYRFNIPAYQRGYRWDNQQISDLLDDLLEFYNNTYEHLKTNTYYCLQPIVVKKRKDKDGTYVYDVIDGQQRLTTIYILLAYLDKQRQGLHRKTYDRCFSLKFDERDDGYLSNKIFETDRVEFKLDVNKFYIRQAYLAIDNWFNEQDDDLATPILISLLGLKGDEKNGVTKVIWYDASESADTAIEVFTRLNYGKIPLTDAELIKALLLICDHYPQDEQAVRKETSMRMSNQWDEMENALHDPFLWGMITSSEHSKISRIGLLINKVVRDIKRQCDEEKKQQEGDAFVSDYNFSEDKEYFDYHVINQYLKLNGRSAAAVDKLWQKIQDTFTVVRNWAADREVYHYLGYLTYLADFDEKDKRKKAMRVNALVDSYFSLYLSPDINKQSFIERLRYDIGNKIRVKRMSELRYINNKDKKSLIKILLLFNIEQAIVHKAEHLFYPFILQKEQNITSLEHIHPQHLNTDFTKDENDFNKIVLPWLKSKEHYLTDDDLVKCHKFQNYDVFKNEFELVKEFIMTKDKFFSEEMAGLSDDEMHSIRNMALVSTSVNSALSNGFMADKRMTLAWHENSGDYIPLGTWIVFNKKLTPTPTNLTFWEKEDRDAYYNAVYDCYTIFAGKEIHNDTEQESESNIEYEQDETTLDD